LLQEDLITRRQLLTYADFATAVAIGRIAPGANGLFVLPIGYYISGLSGALVAALGIMLPPLLAIGIVRAQQRLADRHWVAGMVRRPRRVLRQPAVLPGLLIHRPSGR
jgi:chromate transporter